MSTTFKGPVISTLGFTPGTAAKSVTYADSGSVTIDPASIGAATTGETSVTITGAATGDVIVFNPPSTLEAGIAVAGAYVSATDTAKLRLANVTAAPIDPASASWTYLLVRMA